MSKASNFCAIPFHLFPQSPLSDPDEFDPSIVSLKRNQSELFEKSAPFSGDGGKNDSDGGKENKIEKQEIKVEKKADGEVDKKTYKENSMETDQGKSIARGQMAGTPDIYPLASPIVYV